MNNSRRSCRYHNIITLITQGLLCILALASSGCVGHYCVSGETLIETPTGRIRADTLAPGDTVISSNHLGDASVAQVESVVHRTGSSAYRIMLQSGVDLIVSDTQPISTGRGWRTFEQLAPGDQVLTLDGYETVRQLGVVVEPVKIYSFSLTPDHTFFANGVAIHNKTIRPAEERDVIGLWIGTLRGAPPVYRLNLLVDHIAELDVAFSNNAIVRSASGQWKIAEGRMVAEFMMEDGHPIGMTAEIGRDRLDFAAVIREGGGKERCKVWFIKEDWMRKTVEQLTME